MSIYRNSWFRQFAWFAIWSCLFLASSDVRAADAPSFADRKQADLGSLDAVDLRHGQGAAQLSVVRVWVGSEGIDRCFGAGWGDNNLVRLTPIGADQVLLWRAGRGWQLADRDEQGFATCRGTRIQAAADGWNLQTPLGDRLSFDLQGRLLAEVLAVGAVRNYAYDKQGRLISVSAGPGNCLSYRYDAQGRIEAIEGPEGLQVTYQYDNAGRLASIVDARQLKTEYQYDAQGQLVQMKDSFGRVTAIGRTGIAAHPDSKPPLSPLAAASLLDTEAKLDPQGRVTEFCGKDGTTRFEYDAQGRLGSRTSAEGTTRFEYDAFSREVAVVGPDGLATRRQYNALDLPTLIEYPDGRRERFQYTPQGLMTRREASADDWEVFDYDQQGRTMAIRRANGDQETYSYDAEGRVTEVCYPSGQKVRYDYSADGRSVAEQWSTGAQFRRTYDAGGNLIERQDPAGLITRFVYDAQGSLTACEDPLHGKTRFVHSPNGLQRCIENAATGRTVTDLMPDGTPWCSTDPLGRKTFFQHNLQGQPTLVALASGRAWTYAYDAKGQWTGAAVGGVNQVALSYDAAGRVSEIRRGAVVWRTYRYDEHGRLLEEHSPLGMAAKHSYSAQGKLQKTQLPEGAVTLQEEHAGQTVVTGPDYRVEEEIRPDGSLARRSYQPCDLELQLPLDAQGRPAGIVAGKMRAEYGYDDRGQLNRISFPGGKVLVFQSDAAGRATQLEFGAVRVGLSYDKADRIAAIDARAADQSFFKEGYGYSAAGNLTFLAGDNVGSQRMGYDREDRLIETDSGAKVSHFAYDAAGNCTQCGDPLRPRRMDTDPQGRLTSVGFDQFRYDSVGNVAGIDGRHDTIETAFDAAGKLTALSTSKGRWRFGYLPGGDRLWQEGPGGRTWYAYLPEGLAAMKTPEGTTWLIVRQPGGDRPLALCGSEGTMLLVVADRLGSVRRLVDAEGKVSALFNFGPWGELVSSLGSSPWAEYSGMLVDVHGFWYARHRYYWSQAMRFISPDPLPGRPGEPATHNAYAYASNNPYRYRDPEGLGEYLDDINDVRNLGLGPFYEYVRTMTFRQNLGTLTAAEQARASYLNDLHTQCEKILNGEKTTENVGLRWNARRKIQELTAQMRTMVDRTSNRLDSSAGGSRVKLNPGAGMPSTFQRGNPTLVNRVGGGGPSSGNGFVQPTGRLGTALGIAGQIKAVYSTARQGAEYGRDYVNWLDRPFAEDRRSQRDAEHAGNEFRNRLVRMLNDPTRRGNLPPRADGKPWDPTNPDHFDDLFNGVINNINKNKPPFAGIAAAPDDTFKAVLEQARGLITSARVYRRTIDKAEAEASKNETQAQADLGKAAGLAAAKGALYAQLLGLSGAASDASSAAKAAERAASGLKAAASAANSARSKAEAVETTVCGYAGRTGSAAEVQQWQQQSDSLIADTEAIVSAAETAFAPISKEAGALKAAMDKLKTFQDASDKLSDLNLFLQTVSKDKSTLSEHLASAQGGAAMAVQARGEIPQWKSKLDALIAQVHAILKSYENRPEAQALGAQADSLAGGQDAGGAFDFSALLAVAEPLVESFLQTADSLTGSFGAINVAQTLADAQTSLEQVSNFDSRQAQRDLAAAQGSLAAAKKCRSLINGGGISSGRVKVPDVTGMKIRDAEAALRNVGLVPGATLVGQAADSSDNTWVAAQEPSAGVEVDVSSTISLGYWATVVETPLKPKLDVQVPDVIGQPANQAYANVGAAGLKADSVMLGETPPPGKEGTVKSQNPPAGANLRHGNIVQLEIYGKVVPSVIGWRLQMAFDILSQVGLQADKFDLGRVAPSEADVDRVYMQLPPAGSPITSSNPTIKLYAYGRPADASDGSTPSNPPTKPSTPAMPPDASPTVPNLVGLKGDSAEQAIRAAGYAPQVGEGDRKPQTDDDAGRVYAQAPAAGTPLAKGGAVSVVIYSKPDAAMPPDASPTVPNLVGLKGDSAEQAIRAAGYDPQVGEGDRKPQTDDDAGRVYAQAPAAGTPLAKGGAVSVVVYPKPDAAMPPDASPTVPNVVGLKSDVAEESLRAAGYAAQSGEGARTPGSDNDVGRVYAQSPAAGLQLARGETVSIVIYPQANPQPPAPPSTQGVFAGEWQCSCGGTWHLSQNGDTVMGRHTEGNPDIIYVSGTVQNGVLAFGWRCTAGPNGGGVMIPSVDAGGRTTSITCRIYTNPKAPEGEKKWSTVTLKPK